MYIPRYFGSLITPTDEYTHAHMVHARTHKDTRTHRYTLTLTHTPPTHTNALVFPNRPIFIKFIWTLWHLKT